MLDIARDVAKLFMAQFGQQTGEVCMVERAPKARKAIWRELKLAPRGIDREVVDVLHRTHMGDDQDPEHICCTRPCAPPWPTAGAAR